MADDYELLKKYGLADEEDDYPTTGAFKRPLNATSHRKPRNPYLDGDEEEEEEQEKPQARALAMKRKTNEEAEMLKDVELLVTVKRIPEGSLIIPHAVQEAAAAIAKNSDITLSREARRELASLRSKYDEFAIRDPLVVLRATEQTGTCVIFMSELVPISSYLLARHLRLKYFVQITDKIKTKAKTYDEVLPIAFDGKNDEPQGQPFGLADALREMAPELEDFLFQIRYYMFAQGPMSPYEVCSVTYIEEQLEAFADIRSGKTVVARIIQEKKRIEENPADAQ
jgi:hypothetical protein